MLCLAGNEEVVEAARRSEPLRPHKHSHNSKDKQQGREVIRSGGSHFLCRAPEAWKKHRKQQRNVCIIPPFPSARSESFLSEFDSEL